MSRCIELAKCAIQTARPNPMVGAVIVHRGKIIGEGFHRQCGEPHAEVNAIHSVKNKDLLKESTIYVSLEPCSHYGKTPPCSELIVRMGIPRVVIGTADPFPQVSGRGIARLQNAGIDVKVGVMEKECLELNKYFFHFQKYKTPYVILKWAQSADGFIDHERDESVSHAFRISNSWTQTIVHKLRAEVQAILVGTETARKDNPSLNVRYWHGENPLRIVLDRNGRLDPGLNLFDNKVKTIIFTEKQEMLTGRYAECPNIEVINCKFDSGLLTGILTELGKRSIQSLLVEGGAHLLQSFIDNELWQEATIETSPVLIRRGVKSPELKDYLWKSCKLIGYNKIDSYLRINNED